MKRPIYLLSIIYNYYQYLSIYIGLLSLLFIPVGLLFSRGLLSVGFITFISNWVLEGGYKQKWILLKQQKAEMIISLIFLLHLVGMAYTSNIGYGLADLKIKLPLLFPIFLFSYFKLSKIIKADIFLYLFAFSTVVSTLVGFIRFEYILKYQTVDDLKNITFMGQNIMLSLFVNFSIFIFFHQLFLNWYKHSGFIRNLLIICVIWLIVFLYLLNSLTGYFTFGILVLYSIIKLFKTYKRKLVIGLLVIFGISAISSVIYVDQLISNFYLVDKINFQNLEKYTVNARKYENNLNSKRIENGHYIDIYICTQELESEWKKQSQMNLSGQDKKGQVLSETLIRYLTSKGLRKDSAGFKQLNGNDISYIENGCANYKYISKYSLEARIYNIIWQINTYENTGNANAQSISQRVEFYKSAIYIIRHHFWFGVGTGDVMDTFNKTLKEISPKLDEKYRNRVHNQFVVEFTALGIIGFVIFIIIIFYPVLKNKIWKEYLFSIFYLIILISFLTDNPLETQLGVSFFSYFFCVLSLGFGKGFSSNL